MLRISASSFGLASLSTVVGQLAPVRPAGRVQKEWADHDELRRAPRQQGGVSRRRVAGEAFGVQVRREAIALLQAGEARACGQRSEAHGSVGGDGDGVAGGHLLEHGRDGRAVGVGFEEGGEAVVGCGAFFLRPGLPFGRFCQTKGRREGLELGGFGVGLAGAAEEDLVFAAGCCVVGPVVLEEEEEEARGCGVGCDEREGGVCGGLRS